MAISQTLHADTINIPETDETDWGAAVTAFLDTFAEDLNAIAWQDADGNVFIKYKPTTTTLADGATLTPDSSLIRLEGTSGAITLDATTAITDGEVDGQALIIRGTSNTNTVKINTGANTNLNGPITLTNGDVIKLFWDSTSSEWVEMSRNN